MDRKDFLKQAGIILTASCTGAILYSCSNPADGDFSDDNIVNSTDPGFTVDGNQIKIDLGSEAGQIISQLNGWLLIRDRRILVINTDGQNINAFSSQCPHAACATSWASSNGNLTCTCHGSVFTGEGEVIQGPATRDLTFFESELTTEVYIITLP